MKRTPLVLLLAFLVVVPLVALAAWPTTPLTTYVANTTPVIKAADLNAFQSAINRAFLGTYSFRALDVDGTGGAGTVTPAGSVRVSRVVSSTSVPSAAAVAQGEVNKGLVPICWAQVKSDASGVWRGVNVFAVGRWPAGAATGDYYVDCDSSPGDLDNSAPIVSSFGTPVAISAGTTNNGGGRIRVHVQTAGNVDSVFNLVVYAE